MITILFKNIHRTVPDFALSRLGRAGVGLPYMSAAGNAKPMPSTRIPWVASQQLPGGDEESLSVAMDYA